MARFVRLTGCPQCGSRDNLALYDDGSGWCFGCHYYQKREANSFIPVSNERGEAVGNILQVLLTEDTTTTEFPLGVIEHLTRFNISIAELLRLGAVYRKDRQHLLIPYRDAEGILVCVQGRNFGNRGPKYFNWGSTYPVVCLLGKHDNKQVVITEDVLSAVKVARVTHAWPALGTQFQLHKLVYLQKQGFQQLVVWLDSDKWRESREICERAQWLGLSARAVFSEEDPKSYTNEEIMRYLQ